MEELKLELETVKAKLQMSEKRLEEQNNTKVGIYFSIYIIHRPFYSYYNLHTFFRDRNTI